MPDDEFRELVASEKTYTGVLRRFGLGHKGSNSVSVRKRCDLLGINREHFEGSRTCNINNPAQPLAEILVEHSAYSRSHLKERLIKAGRLKNECSICGLGSTWNGRPIQMRLDHINGVGNDCRFDNLRMVCPNCDSQLDTFGSRNKRKIEVKVATESAACKSAVCSDCGGQLKGRGALRCRRCNNKNRHVTKIMRKGVWPPDGELLAAVSVVGASVVSRRVGVSETAVRKMVLRIRERKGP
jgi:hypothetical protein